MIEKIKITKSKMLKEISRFNNLEYIMINDKEQEKTILMVECDWNQLKVVPEIPINGGNDMNDFNKFDWNRMEQMIRRIVEEVVDKKLEEKLEEKLEKKLNEKLKPIYDRLDAIERRLDIIEEDIRMLKSFHVEDIKRYKANLKNNNNK
ncbi:hypothetical protein ACJA27_00195 [Mycoplasmopsis lipophila]|uniref:hypothetical protein n=1 Tax=Mycoplasmopsis lipophila TaxID=2117 RepID=UPI00387358FB